MHPFTLRREGHLWLSDNNSYILQSCPDKFVFLLRYGSFYIKIILHFRYNIVFMFVRLNALQTSQKWSNFSEFYLKGSRIGDLSVCEQLCAIERSLCGLGSAAGGAKLRWYSIKCEEDMVQLKAVISESRGHDSGDYMCLRVTRREENVVGLVVRQSQLRFFLH